MPNLKPSLLALGCSVAFLMAACANAPQGELQSPLASGVLLENLDTSVRPQDDFFDYVNGTWIATTEIPADKSAYGGFTRLAEESVADVRSIIEQAAASQPAAGSPEAKIGLLYNSFMDEERVNAAGLDPLAPELAQIARVDSLEDLLAYFGRANYAGLNTPLGLEVGEDFKDTTRYLAYLGQGGLGLPNSDYYSDESEKGQSIIAAYQAYVTAVFQRLGYSAAQAEAATGRVYALEAALASHHRPPQENREYTRWYNLYGSGQQDWPAGVPWDAYLGEFGLNQDMVLSLSQPEFAEGLASVLADFPLPVWREYLQLRAASSTAPYLDEGMQELNFDFYSRTLQGTPEQRPRWKRGVTLVNDALGEAVGQIYVREHFPPEAKARMDALVANLLAAYHDSISQLDWMSPETRERALEKLGQFTPNIGYPEKWKDYSGLVLGDDLVANVRAANRWAMQEEIAKLSKPVDPHEWFMTPQTVNAYYYSLQNSITFPAAILQPPFFDMNADDAVNYGAIGSVIGHEIGHGFDDNGSQFDGAGRLNNWWTDADRDAFQQRTAVLIEQFDEYEVLPGVFVNGTLTQGENIGDLAGVSIAYQAYLKSLEGKAAPVLDGYTGEQRFFIGFAQAFLNKAREERTLQLVKIDVHSPDVVRVNGALSNVPAFYEAFDVKPGDKLYRSPEARVKIW